MCYPAPLIGHLCKMPDLGSLEVEEALRLGLQVVYSELCLALQGQVIDLGWDAVGAIGKEVCLKEFHEVHEVCVWYRKGLQKHLGYRNSSTWWDWMQKDEEEEVIKSDSRFQLGQLSRRKSPQKIKQKGTRKKKKFG